MICPKCTKRFPLTEHYCEACSAMLDPVEIASGEGEGEMGSVAGSVPCVGSDDFEDMRIAHLRADIEKKFVYTLLLERDKLNRRLAEKEQSLEELQRGTSDTDEGAVLAAARKEKDISTIVKQIAGLESTLDEMEKTLGGEIEDLQSRLNRLEEPGLFWLLRAYGRYYRMLVAQMSMKEHLVTMLREKALPRHFKMRMPGTMYLFVSLSVILTFAFSWTAFTYWYKPRVSPSSTGVVSKVADVGKEMITEKDIVNLLQDIKEANLRKDLRLWESRYSKQYLELPGKKASVVEQWKNFDYQSLDYKVDGITLGPDTARANILWHMELSSRKSKAKKSLSQNLSAVFLMEDGKLKIRSVTKQ